MADACARHHGEHTVQNAIASPQDADKHQLLAVNLLGGHGFQWCFDFHVLGGHVTGDFVGHQAAEFIQQAAETVGAGVLVAHQRELVLHQRMVDQVDVGAGCRVDSNHGGVCSR